MFTIAAFSESQDPGGVAVPMAGVPDQHMRVVGDQIFINQFNRLMGAFSCAGASATLVRLISPSLRRVNPLIVRPLELGLTPAGNPVHDVDINRSLPLVTDEGLECHITSNPAAAEQASTVIFLSDSQIQMVAGSIFTIHFQVTLALVAGAWAFAEIDLVDELPLGQYSVVGGALLAANGVAFRFVPVGGMNRPGAPTVPDEDNDVIIPFRFGNLGEWFKFHTTSPPGVEILSSAAAASATYDGYMDIIPA